MVSNSEQEIEEYNSKVNSQLQQLDKSKQEIEIVANEPIPERKFRSGVNEDVQQQYIDRRNKARDELVKIQAQRNQIMGEQNRINQRYEEAKKEIRRKEKQQDKKAVIRYNKYQGKINYTDSLGQGMSIAPEIAEKNIKEYNDWALKQQSIADEYKIQRQFIREVKESPTLQQTYEYYKNSKPIYSFVMPVEEPTDLIDKARFKLSNVRQTSKSDIAKFGAGLATPVVNLVDTGRILVTKPQEIPKGVAQTVKKAYKEGFPEATEALLDEPAYAVGRLTGEIGLYKAPTLVLKASDRIRVLNLNKIETAEVIAPEYFQGQSYPRIRKGETAGQLLGEFKPFFDDVKPSGYTASPAPIKNPVILKGSSELPGLYQAPKLSPNFLKVTNENPKLIGLNPLPTLRPSAFRVTPTEYKLLPNVKGSTKDLVNIRYAKNFFETKAEKGVSYVPFVKTEKEAVIPFDTQLRLKNKRYYFEFEGRKIPIYEYDAVKGNVINKGKFKKLDETYSSYYKSRRSSVINPYSSSLFLSYFKSYSSLSVSYKQYNSISSSISKTSKSISKSYTNYNYNTKSYNKFNSGSYKLISQSYNIKVPNTGKGLSSEKYKFLNNLNKNNDKITQGYVTLIKRYGRYTPLKGLREKGLALEYGELVAKKTLAASFKVVKADKLINAKATTYKPDRLFRGYRIKEGKKLKLNDEFIQRLGKRLSSRYEVRAIQAARARR